MDDTGMSRADTAWASEYEAPSSVAFVDQYAWSEPPESYPPTGAEYASAPEHLWPRRIAWMLAVLVFSATTGSLVWVADTFGSEGAYVPSPVLAPITTTEPPPLPPPAPVTQTETLPPVTETITTAEQAPPPRVTYIPTPVMAPPPPPQPPVIAYLRLPFFTIPIPINPPPPR